MENLFVNKPKRIFAFSVFHSFEDEIKMTENNTQKMLFLSKQEN